MDNIKKGFLDIKRETQILVDSINTKDKNYIQNYLYFFHYPVSSLVESVILLCEYGKYNSAKILLRTLFESHINVIYHQVGDKEYRLAVSAKSGFDEKIKIIRGVKDLIRKYPNLESSDPTNLFNKGWLDTAENWAKTKKQEIVSLNNLNDNENPLDLMSKAIKCDEEEIKGSEPGHFQRMYEVIYRQLSQPSHMSIDGLHNYIDQDESGKYLFNEGGGGNFLSTQAIELYFALVKDLYDNGVIEGGIPQKIHDIESEIKGLEVLMK